VAASSMSSSRCRWRKLVIKAVLKEGMARDCERNGRGTRRAE
jgi:hypothetical protein